MRVKIVIDNLEYDNVKKLLDYLDNQYDDNDDIALASAKSLIKKRKRELEK